MTTRKQAQPKSNGSYLNTLQMVLDKLREVPLFAHLNEAEMRAVGGLFQQTSAQAGQSFVWRGGTDTHLYIIRTGRVFARTPDNIYTEEQLNSKILRDGWVFNQDSFLTGQPNEHAFEAMDDGTTVWRVPRDGFLDLLQRHPTLRNNLNAPTLIAPSTVTVEEVHNAHEVMADHTHIPADNAPFDIFERLKAKGPFKGLDVSVIKEIVKDRTVIELKPGELIVERGGTDTSLYIVTEGRLMIREATDKYVDKRKMIVSAGGTANDVSFMTGRQNYETLEALQNLKMWAVKREHFQAYLQANPEISARLQPEPEIKKILDDQAQHDWLQEGEVMMVFQRKHWWVIVESSWVWWITLALLVGGNLASRQYDLNGQNLYGLLMNYQFGQMSPVRTGWVILFISVLLLLAWHLYDWYNDFYAVTDRRVVHREEVKWVSRVFNEAPIEKVQNVTVNRRTLASAFLNMGDVEMDQVGSDARVIFAHITNPESVAKAVTTQQHRRSITEKASDREKRREQVRKQMELKDRPGDLPPAPKAKMNVRRKPWDSLLDHVLGRDVKHWLGTLLPVGRLVVGDDVVYRKHPFDLFINVGAPLALVLLYGGVLVYAWLVAPVLGGFLLSWPFYVPVGVVGLFLVLWLVYRYEDWRNDFFVLGKDKVIDIDRKPFGISSQRREAGFDKIQGITSTSTGTLNQILGIGDVIIATGAAGNELVWQRVANPEAIQKEITTRIATQKRKQEEDRIVDEYQRWAEWLGIYDELARVHEREQLK